MGVVSIVKCKDYEYEKVKATVNNAIDLVGGIKKYVKPGMKVALKPNLLIWKKPEEAATTNPTIVKAVCEIVQEAGGIVTIAESPGGPYNVMMLKRVYSATGIDKVSNETGAILNFDLRVAERKCDEAEYLKMLKILKPLHDADIIINLPKLKTHMMMVYTGAVKNMFGAIAGTMKADYHLRLSDYDKFANALIDIYVT